MNKAHATSEKDSNAYLVGSQTELAIGSHIFKMIKYIHVIHHFKDLFNLYSELFSE